eukprot:TRINITY_DN8703_c0_g1_i1.p1 TRINITY_DN8703_c0_g1~~TRINITY_DN8703_c0_g1_i1.p1  ORF type:complete len:694 (+),score=66.61 TRINITY_DN8703_c0_g1_i1:57-2138(+)
MVFARQGSKHSLCGTLPAKKSLFHESKLDQTTFCHLESVENAVREMVSYLNDRERALLAREQALGRQVEYRRPVTPKSKIHSPMSAASPSPSILNLSDAFELVDKETLENAVPEERTTICEDVVPADQVPLKSQDREQVVLRAFWSQVEATSYNTSSFSEEDKGSLLRANAHLESGTNQSKASVVVRSKHRFLIRPEGRIRICWNLSGLLLIMYDILAMPTILAFDLPDNMFTFVLNLIGAAFWALDVLMTFRTGYYNGSTLVMDPAKIARTYARTWLGVDLLLVLLELLTLLGNQLYGGPLLRITRAVRVVRCTRIMRFARVQWLLLKFEDVIATDLLMLMWVLVKMTLGLLVAVHISSCGWYMIGRLTSNGWTTTWYEESAAVTPPPDSFPYNFFFWYAASARWMLAQLNGKTDDNVRRNMQEMAYTSVIAVIFPVIVSALFISSITQTLGQLGAAAEEGARRRKLVCKFLQANRISGELVSQVKRSVAHALVEEDFDKDMAVEAEVVELLPKHLQSDLVFQIRSPLVRMHPLFNQMSFLCPRALRHVCLSGWRHIVAHRNEEMFHYGDCCNSMVFLSQGRLHYIHHSEADALKEALDALDHESEETQPVGEMLSRGIWLCEPAIFVEWINCGVLEAASSSSLLSLSALDFERTLKDYRSALELAASYSRELVRELNKVDKWSDLIEVLVH